MISNNTLFHLMALLDKINSKAITYLMIIRVHTEIAHSAVNYGYEKA